MKYCISKIVKDNCDRQGKIPECLEVGLCYDHQRRIIHFKLLVNIPESDKIAYYISIMVLY